MRFFRDAWIMFITEVRRYYRWKERIIFDSMLVLIAFLTFALVWKAVLQGGFEGIGSLNKDNFVVFLLSGSVLWQLIAINLDPDTIYAFASMKWNGTLAYFLVSPISKLAILYGLVGLSLVRFFINSVLTILLALVLFDFTIKGSIIVLLLIMVITFFAFSGLGAMLTALSAYREGLGSFTFVLSSLLYLVSGVYYPIEIFPEALQKIFLLLPTTQALNAFRNIVLNGVGISAVLPQIIYLLIFGVITTILGYYSFKWVRSKAEIVGI